MTAWILAAILVLAMIVADVVIYRRRVERLAELAGIRRFPGETTAELERRIGDRFRIVDGGPRS